MKTLNKELDQYLEIRRSLGYKLATEERILRRFVGFARQSRASHITSELFFALEKKVWPCPSGYMGASVERHSCFCPVASWS